MVDWKPGAKLPEPIRRQLHELHNYPIELRWDFLRRHPYYIAYWQELRRYYDGPSGDSQERREFGFRVKLLLGAIGLYGPPVNPGSTVGTILEGSEPALLSGSLQPMTLRMMASMLIQYLDPESKAFLVPLLLHTANAANDPKRSLSEINQIFVAATNSLNLVALPGFEKFADAPLFFMHLGSSLSAITSDAVDQAKRWKKRKGITDSPKIRKDKYAKYLTVWNQREGWTGEGYDRRKELKLREIATQQGEPIGTIVSQYQQAFRLIIGVEYSPELWLQAFGPVKVGSLFRQGTENQPAGVKRRIQTVSRRPVTMTKLGSNVPSDESQSDQRLLDVIPAPEERSEIQQELADFRSMVAEGKSDQQIALGLKMQIKNVRYLRDHLEDFKGY